MTSDHRIVTDLAVPAVPMTGANIEAFIARAKAERAASMRDSMLKLARRFRRLLSGSRRSLARLPPTGTWASPRA